jgi:hypothetical protein
MTGTSLQYKSKVMNSNSGLHTLNKTFAKGFTCMVEKVPQRGNASLKITDVTLKGCMNGQSSEHDWGRFDE